MNVMFVLILAANGIWAADWTPESYSMAVVETAETRVALEKGCRKWTADSRCAEIIAGGKFTTGVVETCFRRDFSQAESIRCLEIVKGVSFPAGVLAACGKMNSFGVARDANTCLSYFKESSSIFDEDAATFCLENAETRHFIRAQSCLNMIRDRDVDLEAIKGCWNRGFREALRTTVDECLTRATAKAPLKRDVICAKRPAVEKASSSGEGTRRVR